MEKSIWINNVETLKSAFRVFDVMNTGAVTIKDLKALFGGPLFKFSEKLFIKFVKRA